MNKYVAPELELVKLSVSDIILTSGNTETEAESSVENMLPIA